MGNWLRDNRKNVFLAVLLTFSFYLVVAPLVYTNSTFQDYLDNRSRSEEVLGSREVKSEKDFSYYDEEIREVLRDFVNDLRAKNFERIYRTTDIGRGLDFSKWHDVKSAELNGGVVYEGEDVALTKINFVFFLEENNFEYPLTVVLVFEKDESDWQIADMGYNLDRYSKVRTE